NGAPTAAGNVGKADVVAESETAEEEGYSEGCPLGQITGEVRAEFGQVGRVDPEGEGLFYHHEEVRLEGVANEGQAAAEYCPANVIQIAMAGVVLVNGLLGLGQQDPVGVGLIPGGGVKAAAEQLDQLQRNLRMGAECVLDIFEAETVRLVVGQVRMAEGHEGIDQ